MSDMTAAENSALRKRVFLSAICFVLGLATVFVALGATASAVGQAMGQYKDLFTKLGGALIVIFGLHFIGVIKIPLLYREARVDAGNGGGGFVGAYLMGLAFAFGWTPCVGPILAAILFQAAQADTLSTGVLLLFVYSMGLGLPFLIAAAFINPFLRFMQKFKRHLGTVEKVMGGLLILVGVLFITGGFTTFSYWMLETFPGLASIESLADGGEDAFNVGYVTAFLGGLLSFLSPCVLPLAPPYLAYLAGSTLDQITRK